LQSWRLEGRNADSGPALGPSREHWDDDHAWTALRTHANDDSIPIGGWGVGCWPVEGQEGLGFRFLRILMTRPTATNASHFRLLCCGLEVWGILTDTTPA